MKFLEEENPNYRINPKTVIISLTMIMLSGFLFYRLIFSTPTFIIGNSETDQPPLHRYCSLIGEQIVAKKLSERITDENVFSVLSANNYKILEFTGKESLLGTTPTENNQSCLIFIRDDLGVRTFSLSIDSSKTNFAYYKVTSIKEL